MTPEACAEIVQRFYAITGRRLPERPAEIDAVFATWEEAIGDLPDDALALAAAVDVIRTTDMRYGIPSPVVLREAYIELGRRTPSRQRALVEETSPVLASPETGRAAIHAITVLMQRQKVPGVLSSPGTPAIGQARPKNDAHAFGDHTLCGSDCALKNPDPAGG